MSLARYWTAAQEAGQVTFDFWPLRRPNTKHWGSGDVFRKVEQHFGRPDAAFGVTDGIPLADLFPVMLIDRRFGFEWATLPLVDNEYAFGYWDPPYHNERRGPGNRAKLFRPEAQEIWRVCQRLAILHTHVYPRAWFKAAAREAMVAVTMGPLKQVRLLQIFRKSGEAPQP